MTETHDCSTATWQSNPDFESLFNPKSIAIVGASESPAGGSRYLLAMRRSGFTEKGGKIYLINPKFKGKELFGTTVFGELRDPAIPKPVDIVIVSVPAKIVPQVVRDCQGLARFGVIFTSGFRESGHDDVDKELRDAIFSGRTRWVGPNCLGVLDTGSRAAIYEELKMIPGNVSFVAQSGGQMMRSIMYLSSLGLGFKSALSIGNAYDVSPSEIIDYYSRDGKTKVVAMYMEAMKDGHQLMEIAKRVTWEMPLIIWKGGSSERGKVAAASHTAGIAGSFEVFKGACKQNGVIWADHFELFMDYVITASIRPKFPRNLNVGIVAAGGGIGVEMTDSFSNLGLNVVDLHPATQEKLAKLFPDINTSFKNPVDTGEYGYFPDKFAQALRLVCEDPNIGSVVFVREPERFPFLEKMFNLKNPEQQTIESLKTIAAESPLPMFCTPSANSDEQQNFQLRHDFQVKMIQAGIPVVNFMPNIARIIKRMYDYRQYLVKRKKELRAKESVFDTREADDGNKKNGVVE